MANERAGRLAVMFAVMVLAGTGCQGTAHLHNPARASVAVGAKEAYAKVDLEKVLRGYEANLDRMLAKEKAAVRANRDLIFQRDLLQIADGNLPMAGWVGNAEVRIRGLGFESSAHVLRFRQAEIAEASRLDRIGRRREILAQQVGAVPPSCRREGNPPPKSWPALAEIEDEEERAFAEIDYGAYLENCKAYRSSPSRALSTGAVGWASSERVRLEAELGERTLQAQLAARQVKVARAEYKDALEARQAGGELEIVEHAERISGIVGKVRSAAGKVSGDEALAGEQLDALETLLAALAGGSIDEAALKSNPELVPAATLAQAAPGLLEDMRKLLKDAQGPTVSNLLIALQYQATLVDDLERTRALLRQRIGLADRKVQLLVDEAARRRELKEALCRFATGGLYSGTECDALRLECSLTDPGSDTDRSCSTHRLAELRETATSTNPVKVTCSIGDEPIANCPLAQSWKALDAAQGRRKAELLEGIAALSRVHLYRTRLAELRFEAVDLEHREALSANQTALRAWDELIRVPLDQLAAYHAGGVKPEEIAELVIQALGFTAITAGVSQ